jgi:transposase, IS30 family
MPYKQLTLCKRYEIQAYMQAGISNNKIVTLLGVHRSTFYHELKRNRNSNGYNSEDAQAKSDIRRKRARKHVHFTESVKEQVESLLKIDLSPEQISGYLAKDHQINISHETIYQHVLSDKRSGGDLHTHLRWSEKKRRKRYGASDRRGQIEGRVSIEERPLIVDTKERIGDWEADTVIGKGYQGVLVTAVERKSKYTVIHYSPSKRADRVTRALIDMLKPYQDSVLTITVDNGKEFSLHKQISKELKADVYFAHPYRAWERGLNENTIGLIRQYFPKKTNFKRIRKEQINFVESRLNRRPRKALDFRAPFECFYGTTVALGT